MHLHALESRLLFAVLPSLADLLVDANRDGQITLADDFNENVYSDGRGGRGAGGKRPPPGAWARPSFRSSLRGVHSSKRAATLLYLRV